MFVHGYVGLGEVAKRREGRGEGGGGGEGGSVRGEATISREITSLDHMEDATWQYAPL